MRLNTRLDDAGFDAFVEAQCRRFYAPVTGRPSLAPGRYFRLLLIGYFEGLGSERGIALRAALAVRSFLRLGLEDAAPDHFREGAFMSLTLTSTRETADAAASHWHHSQHTTEARAPIFNSKGCRHLQVTRLETAGAELVKVVRGVTGAAEKENSGFGVRPPKIGSLRPRRGGRRH